MTIQGPPTAELDENGEWLGYNPSFTNEVADRLALPVTFHQTEFEELIGLVESHVCDLSVNSQNITAERLERLQFVPYTQTSAPGIVATGNPAGIQTLDDLCGRAVSAVTGTTQVDLILGEGQYLLHGLNDACTDSGQPEIDLHSYASDPEAIQALLDGVVVFYTGNPNWVRDYPDQIEQSDATLPPATQGMTIALDHPALFAAVQAAMDAMVADGTYTAILRQFFPTGPLDNVSIIE